MTTAPIEVDRPAGSDDIAYSPTWDVVVWNDPVNLMVYVVWVFRTLFGYPEAQATRLMLQVHNEGRAVVDSGPREQAEMSAFRLHHHGLWATLEKR
ncbi:MAG: ATP-dependent Clp protease adapter ClpS [Acidimicrobiia bacterium]